MIRFRRNAAVGLVATAAVASLAFGGASAALAIPEPSDVFADVVGSDDFFSVYLFEATSGGNYSTTPYFYSDGDSFVGEADVPDGDYLMAFFDEDDSRWVPWTNHNLDGVSTDSTPSNDCGIAFTVDSTTHGDYDFGTVTIDSTVGIDYCDTPPWAAPDSGSLAVHVTNSGDLSVLRATLYRSDTSGDQLTFIDSSIETDPGEFDLFGVTETGDYYVEFTSGPTDLFIDSYVGLAGVYATESEVDADLIHLVGGNNDGRTGVTLLTGRIVSGTVTSGAAPVANVCVDVYSLTVSANDYCASTDENGDFSVKVGLASDYVLYVDGFVGGIPFLPGYYPQYWEGATTEGSATVVDASVSAVDLASYDFDLLPFPANILSIVYADGLTPLDPSANVSAYLYKKSGSTWTKVDEQLISASGGPGFAYVLFPELVGSAFTEVLANGTYMMRFHDSAGWVGYEFALRVSPPYGDDDFDFYDPGCSITFPNVKPGPDYIAEIVLDTDRTSKHCTSGSSAGVSHPTTPGVGAHLLADASDGDGLDIDPTPTPTPTPSVTESPSPSPSPTTSSSPSPSTADGSVPFGWLIGGGVLLLLVVGAGVLLFLRRR